MRLTILISLLCLASYLYGQDVHVSANVGHEEIGDMQISSSGRYLATSYGKTKVWDCKEGYLLHDLEGDVISIHEKDEQLQIVTLDYLGTAFIYYKGGQERTDTIQLHEQGFVSVDVNHSGNRLIGFSNKGVVFLYDLEHMRLLDSKDMMFQEFFDWIRGDLSYEGTSDYATGVLVSSWAWLADLSGDSIKEMGMFNVNAMDMGGVNYDYASNQAAYWDLHSNGYIQHLDSFHGTEVSKGNEEFHSTGFWQDGYFTANTDGQIQLYQYDDQPTMHIFSSIEEPISVCKVGNDALVVIGKKGPRYTIEVVSTSDDEFLGSYTSVSEPHISKDGRFMVLSEDEDLAENELYKIRVVDLLEHGTLHTFPMGWSSDKFRMVTLLNFRPSFQAVAKEGLYIYSTENGKLEKLSAFEDKEDEWFYLDTEWADHYVTEHDSFSIEDRAGISLINSSQQTAITLIFIQNDPDKWVHIHPSGLFDASAEAMDHMYWVKGLEVIEFSQLKARYWLPGLWEKVVKGERLPEVANISEIKLPPEVELGELRGGKLPIKLNKRAGGYGAVSIYINGKEVASDARGGSFDNSAESAELQYNIKNHPYLQNGENTIMVKAASEDGSIVGRGFSITVQHETETVTPSFYGVVVGVSDYANDQIDLKYPVKDAQAIHRGIEVAASNLFGQENTTIYDLRSEGERIPTKENFRKVFQEIANEAKAEDVIFVYLSGHGISWGQGEETDFYFLTADALSANKEDYANADDRKAKTVSTSEMVEWLKDIAALKQLMVLDACGSGAAVDNLLASRNVEASQIKAIDRMKDRTGMYVISGCAADAVSYEASKYGQGLLTYAILEGLSGLALKEGKYVDVFKVLDYARERVPQLAEDVGGIQTPQLLMPRGGSFDIGLFHDSDTGVIRLPQPKQVIIRSLMVDTTSRFKDTKGLRKKLDDAIKARNGDEGWNYIYFDVDEYPNACMISGGYAADGDLFTASISISYGSMEQTHKIQAEGADALIEKILALLE